MLTSWPGAMAPTGTATATTPKLPSCSLTYPLVELSLVAVQAQSLINRAGHTAFTRARSRFGIRNRCRARLAFPAIEVSQAFVANSSTPGWEVLGCPG